MTPGRRALSAGQPFVTAGGRHGTVAGLLGTGGQGDVHEVAIDGARLALKWYHPACIAADVTLRDRLRRAIRRGAPTEAFLWPLDLVEAAGSTTFGYVMPLRGGRHVSIRDLIAPPPRRLELSLEARAAACLHIATCFHELRATGFCYQDINLGNVFLDPVTAEVLICDNDNVDVDGADASIYGTRKFMAPEIVRGEALPCSRTDLYSMAVLFSYVLLGWHPLNGRREAETTVLDAAAERRLYGSEPLFLFDPANAANGPVPGLHDAIVARWRSLGSRLQCLFVRAFTAGLTDPAARVLETEWRIALRGVIDAGFVCAACGFDHMVELRGEGARTPAACFACGTTLAPPPVLRLSRRLWTLTPGRRIELTALRGGTAAAVEPHPTRGDLIGLRNHSERAWQASLPDGGVHTVAPGRAIRVTPALRIDFGGAGGTIPSAEPAA